MFVTFEGPEGAGKSTALKSVAERLRQKGATVLCTREPGAGSLGAKIRELLLHGEDLSPETEVLLFLADRANHVQTIIGPALDRGDVVLCDRFADSTLVYQGYARGLGLDFLRTANSFATHGLKPTLTILFDLDPEVGLARLTSKDRIDAHPLEFHRKVRDGFLELARQDPQRWTVVDANNSSETLAELVFSEVANRLLFTEEARGV
ncbi:MAG TPA: dTMP kinase [Fimbriimonas sp.]|nr:dTMP kinase [Fimbriimonas sp.]